MQLTALNRMSQKCDLNWCNFIEIDYMRKFINPQLLLVLFVPFLMGFCIHTQGVKGVVFLQTDAMMPLKGKPLQKGSPYSTIIFVYESASITQLIGQQGNFAKGVNAKLVKQVRSDNAGKFKLKLSPGKYTIVLGYQEGIYIPFFSGTNGVAHIEVTKNQFQEIDIRIPASSVF
jgi:hypothetical protein